MAASVSFLRHIRQGCPFCACPIGGPTSRVSIKWDNAVRLTVPLVVEQHSLMGEYTVPLRVSGLSSYLTTIPFVN